MSDDSIPPWAEAMEHRIIGEVAKAIADSEGRLRTEMNARFAELREDMTAMGMYARAVAESYGTDDLAELRKIWLRDVERGPSAGGGTWR
jgi:hypothetical protein